MRRAAHDATQHWLPFAKAFQDHYVLASPSAGGREHTETVVRRLNVQYGVGFGHGTYPDQ